MNRNLLVFSLFIIVAGLAFGLYIISFFGLLLFIPALAAPSRPPARNTPPRPAQGQPQTQPWGRVIPRRSSPAPPPPPTPSPMTEPVAPPAPPMASMATSYSVPLPSPAQPVSYTPALFPSPLIPPMSAMGTAPQPQPAKSSQETRHDGRDELVEVGAILAILKLVFG
jgi:hypothetical protein